MFSELLETMVKAMEVPMTMHTRRVGFAIESTTMPLAITMMVASMIRSMPLTMRLDSKIVVNLVEDGGVDVGVTPIETCRVVEKVSMRVDKCVTPKIGPLIC